MKKNFNMDSKSNDMIEGVENRDNICDINKVYDKNMWPENLLTEIFGFYDGYNPNYKKQISEYLRMESGVKGITDKILESIAKEESKFIKSIYAEGESMGKFAKQNKMTIEQIFELKKASLKRLRNPKLAKQYFPIFRKIDQMIVEDQF